MNQTRTMMRLILPGAWALVALIGAGDQARAQAQPPSPWLEVSNSQAVPVRPAAKGDEPAPAPTPAPVAAPTPTPTPTPAPAEPVKVHGTITVDFEKVTIAELLRLTQTLEQVDGVIHIVSARGGEGTDGAVVTIARPDAAALILGEQGAVQRARVQLSAAPPPSPPLHERPAATPFPRLASLGRMLGLRPAEPVPHQHEPQRRQAGPMAVTWESRPGAAGLDGVARASHEAPAFRFQPPAPLNLESVEVEPAPAPAPAVGETATRAPAADESRRRVAEAGDTFESLSRSFYGDARYARALWWANRADIAWPGALGPGKPLVIPAPGELEPRMIVGPDPAGAGVAAASKPRPAEGRFDPAVRPASFTEPTPDQSQDGEGEGEGFAVHVVRPDDTLRAIAREVCGDERRALEIIALNRDILTPEGRIRVGQRLLLPVAAAARPAQ